MNWIQKGIADFVGLDKYINPIYFEKYSSQFVDGYTDYTEFSNDLSKLKAVFGNPAALKVCQLMCNMFAMGKPFVYRDGKEVENHPFLKFIKKPNYFQYRSQWQFDYMFWKFIGNSYCYIDSKIITNQKNKSYFLDSSKITMSPEMLSYRDKLVLSDATAKKLDDMQIDYVFADGSKTKIKWGNIVHIADLTNGDGNWFKGKSKIDALYKIIANSEAAIDNKNINIRYSGKFIVAGKSDPDKVTEVPLGETEARDVESKMNGRKQVHAMKSMIDIKRFVESAAIVGELDDSYMSDYFKIGTLYDIPKDVLEAFNSGTYENQEKARGALVDYCLSPSGEKFGTSLAGFFGLPDNEEILFDWEHLPFMQVFANERAKTEYTKTQSLLNLMKAGVPIEEINTILDLNLRNVDYDRAERSGQNSQTSQVAGENEQ